ncbi:unnamed protein product, partial [Phaeothamnion confervicola]
ALVKADLELLWRIRFYRWQSPFGRLLRATISHNPLRDVSLLTWVTFVVGCISYGFPFFWVCTANLFFAMLGRMVLAAPRPFMYDNRLKPLADRYPSSHGLPSLETHMATVVFFWMAHHVRHRAAWAAAIAIVAFISFSRLYACSRFAHQIAASWATGAAGLRLGLALPAALEDSWVREKHHFFGAAAVAAATLGLVGLWAESNDCRVGAIQKDEFTRVLRGIM